MGELTIDLCSYQDAAAYSDHNFNRKENPKKSTHCLAYDDAR